MNRKVLLELVLLFSLLSLFSLEETIVLGKEDNWMGVHFSNIEKREGQEGFFDLVLKDGEYKNNSNTDLLLHFNNKGMVNPSGNYQVVESLLNGTSKNFVLGNGSGVFQSKNSKITLKGNNKSLFFPGNDWKDFSIEFWLYPANLEEGETVFLFEGARLYDNKIIKQVIRCVIENRKIVWIFDNIYVPPDFKEFTVSVTGQEGLIPRKWHHHMVRFNSSTGLLEYLIDGEPEGIVFVNHSLREDGTVFLPIIGKESKNEIAIGNNITALIDEFRISKEFVEKPFIRRFDSMSGTVLTDPYDLEYANSRIVTINSSYSEPSDSDLFFYYKISNDKLDFMNNKIQWIPFEPGEAFPFNVRGKYIQILVELFPDGLGMNTPFLSNIEIVYEPDLPPLPTALISATAGNESVRVSWEKVPEEDIKGYMLYYGYFPNRYFGTDSTSGQSPIDVGNNTSFVLEGLENGRLYYFSVVSYDSSDPPHFSVFSKEVSARPSALGRNE